MYRQPLHVPTAFASSHNAILRVPCNHDITILLFFASAYKMELPVYPTRGCEVQRGAPIMRDFTTSTGDPQHTAKKPAPSPAAK